MQATRPARRGPVCRLTPGHTGLPEFGSRRRRSDPADQRRLGGGAAAGSGGTIRGSRPFVLVGRLSHGGVETMESGPILTPSPCDRPRESLAPPTALDAHVPPSRHGAF